MTREARLTREQVRDAVTSARHSIGETSFVSWDEATDALNKLLEEWEMEIALSISESAHQIAQEFCGGSEAVEDLLCEHLSLLPQRISSAVPQGTQREGLFTQQQLTEACGASMRLRDGEWKLALSEYLSDKQIEKIVQNELVDSGIKEAAAGQQGYSELRGTLEEMLRAAKKNPGLPAEAIIGIYLGRLDVAEGKTKTLAEVQAALAPTQGQEPPARPQSVPAEGWLICIKSEAYGVSAEKCGCVKCRRELAAQPPAKTEGGRNDGR